MLAQKEKLPQWDNVV